jgi:hypothetical protein
MKLDIIGEELQVYEIRYYWWRSYWRNMKLDIIGGGAAAEET